MRKIGLLAACACLCVAMISRGQNVAVVDMEELIQLHPNTTSDLKLLDQTQKDYMAEIAEMKQKLEGLQEDFDKLRKEALDPALSDKARKSAEERAIKAREAAFMAERTANEKMKARKEQFDEMRGRMLNKTISELREIIGKYADEQKLQLVVAKSQVMYVPKSHDITDVILKQMSVQRPAKTAKEKDDVATPAPAKNKDAAPTVTPK